MSCQSDLQAIALGNRVLTDNTAILALTHGHPPLRNVHGTENEGMHLSHKPIQGIHTHIATKADNNTAILELPHGNPSLRNILSTENISFHLSQKPMQEIYNPTATKDDIQISPVHSHIMSHLDYYLSSYLVMLRLFTRLSVQ